MVDRGFVLRTGTGLLVLLACVGIGGPVPAQPTSAPPTEWSAVGKAAAPSEVSSRSLRRTAAPADARLSHVVGGETFLYNRSDSTAPVASLRPHTPLHRLGCADGWCHVRTDAGRTGYVPAAALSSVWLLVSKADRLLHVYRGPELVDTHKIDVGYNTFADKERRGSPQKRDHWRTPEGPFYVVSKKPGSEFYKALVLNYPTIADAERGLRQDLISRGEYRAIVRAQEQRRVPPMNTELGGWIEIHGEGTGGSTNWTQGCVAVQNRVMDELWGEVKVGTPVLIE
jgi:lipoprotein-anchoring transpeptidase ErfK/SrfK